MKWKNVALACLLVVAAAGLSAQEQGTRNGEWPTYGGNLSTNSYSFRVSDHYPLWGQFRCA